MEGKVSKDALYPRPSTKNTELSLHTSRDALATSSLKDFVQSLQAKVQTVAEEQRTICSRGPGPSRLLHVGVQRPRKEVFFRLATSSNKGITTSIEKLLVAMPLLLEAMHLLVREFETALRPRESRDCWAINAGRGPWIVSEESLLRSSRCRRR